MWPTIRSKIREGNNDPVSCVRGAYACYEVTLSVINSSYPKRTGSTSHVYTYGHAHPRGTRLLFVKLRSQPTIMMLMTTNPKHPLRGYLHRLYLQRTMIPSSAPRAYVRSIPSAIMLARKAL
jgi:hypothetical protein